MSMNPQAHNTLDSMIFAPVWETFPLYETHEGLKKNRHFFILPSQKNLWEDIKMFFPQDPITVLSPDVHLTLQGLQQNLRDLHIVFLARTSWQSGVDDGDIEAFFQFLTALKSSPKVHLSIITQKSISTPLFTSVTHPVDGLYIGFGQTLAKERPEWHVTCLALETFSSSLLQNAISRDWSQFSGLPIVLKEDLFGVVRMKPATLPESRLPRATRFKRGGTYLIIGGVGGLGRLLAEYLARTYGAKLLLIGRRPEDSRLIAHLKEQGASEVVYHQNDLRDEIGLRAFLAQHAPINGVIHSALVLKDASITTMDLSTLLEVLRPKVHGTYSLIRVLKEHRPDFCLFFSSIQSYIANEGQANYTAACVAKDAMADLLHNGLMMDSKVINWGYWGSVGIVATPAYRARMEKLQIGSIEPEEGLLAIERLLKSDLRHITVVKASDLALKRLQIEPHKALETIPPEKSILPVYRREDPRVEHNQSLAYWLQEYTRWRIHNTPLPTAVEHKFQKLLAALKAIPVPEVKGTSFFAHPPSDIRGHVTLLDTCVDSLVEILEGRVDPLSVLFPEGSFALVEPVYRHNPMADYFNQIVAEAVANYQRRASNTPLRILEIGAGTGSTTQFVLPRLIPQNVAYTFTDLSFAFLNKARDRFKDYSFVEYTLCNIEDPQTFPEKFDVIIATNVIHATSRLRTTLSNVRRLLSDTGIFVLNEITTCQDYATVTFGLTQGWWLSSDADRIPNSPLLAADTWTRLLHEAGFPNVESHGGEEQRVFVGCVGTYSLQPVQSTHVVEQKPSVPLMVLHHSPKEEVQNPLGTLEGIKTFLKQTIASVLRFDPQDIEDDRPFNEMGIDSLISMELLKPIKEKIGYIPATILFEYPTLIQLATYIGEAYPESVHIFGPQHTPDKRQESTSSLKSWAIGQIKTVIARTMRMEIGDIEEHIPFQEYGIDSIISLELIKGLKEIFGYMPATLLFEYPTVDQLGDYILTLPEVAARKESSKIPQSPEPLYRTVPQLGPTYREEDIAIIGLSAKLPEADDVAAFWENLLQGRDCTSHVPQERWSSPSEPSNVYTQRGAFMADIDAFDHGFFHLTPKEASRMDPQERLLLENMYHALLDAGYSQKALAGSMTGVFVGVMNGAYAWYGPQGDVTPTSLFWSMANRASYIFGWHGPSMAIDTACSSSLTALHLACQSLRAGECDQAVVGGVNVISHPRQYRLLCDLHMLSKSGVCRPFGAGADGFVDGEGVITCMVKRLPDAERDKDKIYGVIKGSSINAGGRANGYTAPNPEAQSALIARALSQAGVRPADIGYVEAHGTGTELGDPIELRALNKAYHGVKNQSIALGSVKSNIGHLESAAGLSGVLKALLQMHHGVLVPSLHADTLNPHVDFQSSPFVLNCMPQPWTPERPKMSAVSSFGAGGANAHLILQGYEKAMAPRHSTHEERFFVIPLSHHTSAGLQKTMDSLRVWLETHQDCDLEALAYTLACGRDHTKNRIAMVCRNRAELVSELARDLQTRNATPAVSTQGQLPREGSILSQQAARDLASAYEMGQDIPWDRYNPERCVLSLPDYPFMKHRHWIPSPETNFHKLTTLVEAHKIQGQAMTPGAWVISALVEKYGPGRADGVTWQGIIADPSKVHLEERGSSVVLLSPGRDQVFAHIDSWSSQKLPFQSFTRDMTGSYERTGREIYSQFEREGYSYGPRLQGIAWAQMMPGCVKGFLHAPVDWGYSLSPALLDSCLQLAILMPRNPSISSQSGALVPYHVGRITIVQIPDGNEALYGYCIERNPGHSTRARTFDFTISNRDGQVMVALEEFVSVVATSQSAHHVPREVAPSPFEVFEVS